MAGVPDRAAVLPRRALLLLRELLTAVAIELLTARRAFVTLGVALALSTLACSDSDRPTPASSTFDPFGSTASIADAGSTTIAALAVGTCFDADGFTPGSSIELRSVHVVDCAQPHQHEVYAVARDPAPADAPFPGDAAMTSFSNDQCLAAFEPAIGVAYTDSDLDFAPVILDETSWRNGDRNIICAVHDADFAPLTVQRVTTTTASLAPESG